MYFKQIINYFLFVLFFFNIIHAKNDLSDSDNDEQYNDSIVCTFFKCKKNERCVVRQFWCKWPPCSRMVYCAKSSDESLKGPSSCDNVKCSNGYVCIVKVRRCSWDKPCEEEVARCITEMEYYEGPASCAGFKCPSGQDCILRESYCKEPPCKLFRTCARRNDVHMWMDQCKSLGCISAHECFLRRPENVCDFFHCRHKPDCTAKSESELIKNEKCRGWICPKGQICLIQNKRPCKNAECRTNRYCQGVIIKSDTIDNKSLEVEDSNKFLRRYEINPVYGIKSITNRTILNPIETETNQSIKNIKSVNGNNLKNNYSSLSSLDNWLDYLKNQSGMNAVNIWLKKSEDEKNYTEFRKWLTLVKKLLGNNAFDLWLEEIRNITMKNEIFQTWLPISADALDKEFSVFFPWNSTNKEDENQGIYETESLMNPEYKLHTFGHLYNSSNLFTQKLPGARINERFNSGSLGYSEHYYLSALKLIQKLLESITPLIEFNKESLLKQLQNETVSLDDDKRTSLLKILEKLKEEREIYAYVINKTQELISEAQPLVPSFFIDEVIDKLQSIGQRNFLGGRKNNENTMNTVGNNTSSIINIMGRSKDPINDDDVDYLVVDYGEPISDVKINQSAPKIVIRVENNFQPPPKIGEIRVENEDKILNRLLILNATSPYVESTQDDYYNDDEESDFLKVNRDKTNSSMIILDQSKDKKKNIKVNREQIK